MPQNLPALFGTLTHGVYVIGVAAGETRNAFTAAWLMQASFDPPLLALSINPQHSSYRLLKDSGAFSVNVLKRSQTDLAGHFGQPASVDKLASITWQAGLKTGTPILDGALAWFECRVEGEYLAGDHVVVVGRVVDGGVRDASAEALNYRDTGNLDGAAVLFPASF
ncbi:MAG TPA: flavin reductase family protein [Methylococcaceae bacterium]|nr:flavin reductase family protein [Methylococcaceae bacterium]